MNDDSFESQVLIQAMARGSFSTPPPAGGALRQFLLIYL
jgi:hypothetical protein